VNQDDQIVWKNRFVIVFRERRRQSWYTIGWIKKEQSSLSRYWYLWQNSKEVENWIILKKHIKTKKEES